MTAIRAFAAITLAKRPRLPAIGSQMATSSQRSKRVIARITGAIPSMAPRRKSRKQIWKASATRLTMVNGAIGSNPTAATVPQLESPLLLLFSPICLRENSKTIAPIQLPWQKSSLPLETVSQFAGPVTPAESTIADDILDQVNTRYN